MGQEGHSALSSSGLSGQWTWIFCEGEKLGQKGYFRNSNISMNSANMVRVEIDTVWPIFLCFTNLNWPTKILQIDNLEGFKILLGTNCWSFLCYVDIKPHEKAKYVGGAIFADTYINPRDSNLYFNKGDRLCPPHYWSPHPPIFKPSYGSEP